MIISIDEGTTSTRALLINSKGKILLTKQEEIKQIYPQSAWVEQDPEEIWQKTLNCVRGIIKEALAQGIKKEEFEAIAITNQRETSIVWDAKTGKPIYNAIVWQCRRTATYCKELEEDLEIKNYIQARTGLKIDAYFSASKIKWILENTKIENNNDLIFGTIDTWLIWNLTLGREHATDATNASRTMLFDIHEAKWDDKLLEIFKIPKELLPEVKTSDASFNSSPLFKDLLDKELEIKAVIGDQQAALYAYNNESKITYGTGTFVCIPSKSFERKELSEGSFSNLISSERSSLAATERDDVFLQDETQFNGLLESIAFTSEQNQKTEKAFQLEGSIFVGGSIVQWLRDELAFINSSSEIEKLAQEVDDNGGVYLIPSLAGLGAPFWQGELKGAIFGLTRASSKAHIARAALESMAYRVRDIFEVLEKKIKEKIEFINVDGGASKNDFLMQFQADLLQIPVVRYKETEMTALGAAKMTGLVELNFEIDKKFEPKKNLDQQYLEWKNYLEKSMRD